MTYHYRHTPTTRAVLRALVPVICPPEAVAYADAIVDHVELTLGASPTLIARAFNTGVLAYDLGALPRHGARARALVGERAEAYYASWEHGITPLHVQFARALNQLISLACYEQPEMMAAVGYLPAPWIEQVTKKRLTVFADDVAKREAAILAPDPLRPARATTPTKRSA